jgi:hypothetical protein
MDETRWAVGCGADAKMRDREPQECVTEGSYPCFAERDANTGGGVTMVFFLPYFIDEEAYADVGGDGSDNHNPSTQKSATLVWFGWTTTR